MDALFVSTLAVALAEIGDKTQLLALMLAARYKRPVPIILGILVATLANHGIAASLGAWVSTLVSPDTLRWVVAASFIAMGLWILIPDKEDEAADRHRYEPTRLSRRLQLLRGWSDEDMSEIFP